MPADGDDEPWRQRVKTCRRPRKFSLHSGLESRERWAGKTGPGERTCLGGKEEMKLAGRPRSSGAPDDYHGGRSGTKRIGRTAASIDAWDRRGQRA